jgi:hypothetical protein
MPREERHPLVWEVDRAISHISEKNSFDRADIIDLLKRVRDHIDHTNQQRKKK